MLDVLDRRRSGDAAYPADQQSALIDELIAVQARVDASFMALWDLETQLLARVRQGPPGTPVTALSGPASSPESIGSGAPWQRLA